ncbi:hypothetical protein GGI12_003979 [Dipsacomyces acuminosporus]|nr:hypothetical protein GGI12_003979 [Dipsacomyces acuminosporus]
MSIDLLTPALLFAKMTATLDPQLIFSLWNAPLFYLMFVGFSLLWSRTGSRLFKLDKEYARLCDAGILFFNTNSLPIALIKSIALSAGSEFMLKDQNDTPMKVAARGVSYTMIIATLNNAARWSIGVAMMGGVESGTKSTDSAAHATTAGASLPLHDSDDGEDSTDERTPLFQGAPVDSLHRQQCVAKRCIESAIAIVSRGWKTVEIFFTPPVYAIIVAFIITLIEPLHQAFLDKDTVLYAIWSAIDMCGDACVPMLLISLGGQLGLMALEEKEAKSASIDSPPSQTLNEHQNLTASESSLPELRLAANDLESLGDGQLAVIPPKEQRKGIMLVLIGRFVIVPTLTVALITALRIFFPSLVPILADDPVYILTLLILACMPSAINLITFAQATGKFETEAAQILFYGYVLGIFVLAVEVSGFLWLTSTLSKL